MGKVSRNCTVDGWSDLYPHYVDVCYFYDNTSKIVCYLFHHLNLPLHIYHITHTNHMHPTLGSVLPISEGPIHSWLQHVPGFSDYSHGHTLQIQVSVSMGQEILVLS